MRPCNLPTSAWLALAAGTVSKSAFSSGFQTGLEFCFFLFPRFFARLAILAVRFLLERGSRSATVGAISGGRVLCGAGIAQLHGHSDLDLGAPRGITAAGG